jgi:Xaa-Pro aminopeptidase
LNIRGSDVPRNPVLHGFAILHDDARVTLFADPAKFDGATRTHLGPDVTLLPPDALLPALASLTGPVRLDRASAPLALRHALAAAGIPIAWADDPCRLPKARKTAAEIAATREAHLRDGAAMVEFLCWLDAEAPKGTLTEIDVVRALEGFRRATNALHDISFDTICGAGPQRGHRPLPRDRGNQPPPWHRSFCWSTPAAVPWTAPPTSPAPSPLAIRGKRRAPPSPACCKA